MKFPSRNCKNVSIVVAFLYKFNMRGIQMHWESLEWGFSTFILSSFCTDSFFAVVGCAVHSRLFRSTPCFYTLDNSKNSLTSKALPNVLLRLSSLLLKAPALELFKPFPKNSSRNVLFLLKVLRPSYVFHTLVSTKGLSNYILGTLHFLYLPGEKNERF